MNLKSIFVKAIDCVYSFWFDLHFLPLKDAIKIPVYISHRTKIQGKICKDSVVLNCDVIPRSISIGISEATFGLQGDKHSYIMFQPGSKIIFNGSCVFSKGCSLRLFAGGIIEVGNNVYFNQYANISSHTKVHLGDDLLAGWNVNIRDADGHSLFDLENPAERTNKDAEVFIGNHVWLASFTDVLKGAVISNNSVTAYRACVGKKFEEESVILGGLPAKIIKRNISWHI